MGEGGLPAGQDPDSGRTGVGADGHPQGGGQPARHRHAAPGPGGLDRPEGQQLAFGWLRLSGREAAAGEPGALPHEGPGTGIKAVGGPLPPLLQMRHTFATLAISVGENINWVARMLGHQSPVVTLEKYNRYVPNLTREDGKALLAVNAMAKRSGPPESLWGNINRFCGTMVVQTGLFHVKTGIASMISNLRVWVK